MIYHVIHNLGRIIQSYPCTQSIIFHRPALPEHGFTRNSCSVAPVVSHRSHFSVTPLNLETSQLIQPSVVRYVLFIYIVFEDTDNGVVRVSTILSEQLYDCDKTVNRIGYCFAVRCFAAASARRANVLTLASKVLHVWKRTGIFPPFISFKYCFLCTVLI